jgi:nitroreductase
MIKDLIIKNRSYRRFDEAYSIPRQVLEELVDLARLSASASNRQALRFYLASDTETCGKVFSCLKWAGYLTYWNGPVPGERPSAYIIILRPSQLSAYAGHDTGIAAQSILLGAVSLDLGGCMFGSVDRQHLHELLALPQEYETEIVIAIGKPVEQIKIDDVVDDNIKYWRDADQVHHVPKRKLANLIINPENKPHL